MALIAAKHVNRLAARLGSECFLYFGTFAAVVVAIATAIMAITFALQSGIDVPRSHAAEQGSEICRDGRPSGDLGCAHRSADKRRAIRLISTNRAEKRGLNTAGAAVASPDRGESCSVAQLPAADVVAPALTVIPSNHVEVRSSKNEKHQSARARVWREKSFTGAGRSFDTVH